MERKLAAILVADVVGYSRLVEQDEAGTLAALRTWRKEVLEPVVAKNHGRIFKLTGDGVLIEFGSPVEAVRCAVDLQEAVAAAKIGAPEDRHIVLRIGVNLGDVVVEDGDANTRAGFANAPFNHIGDPELLADLLHFDRFALERER